LEDADFAPTSQQIAVNRQYTEQIRNLQAELAQLLAKDLADFNGILKGQNIQAIAATLRPTIDKENAQ
jgi:hypothetical protein